MRSRKQNGFTAVEIMFALSAAVAFGFLFSAFAKDLITLGSSAQASMNATLESRKLLRVMISELRSAIPSAVGSYPIEAVSTSSLVFFADVNSDDIADRIRYFLDQADHSIKRGVVLATGNPPGYTLANEKISILVHDVVNDLVPVFDYYDSNYTGDMSSPLALPVDISDIRLIRITVVIDKDPNRSPDPITVRSPAMLRNLKDNI